MSILGLSTGSLTSAALGCAIAVATLGGSGAMGTKANKSCANDALKSLKGRMPALDRFPTRINKKKKLKKEN